MTIEKVKKYLGYTLSCNNDNKIHVKTVMKKKDRLSREKKNQKDIIQKITSR